VLLLQDAVENISGGEEQEQPRSPTPEINATIAQQEDQRDLFPETVKTANVLTGLDTLEEPIAESAPVPSHEKVCLFHPNRSHILSSSCILILVLLSEL